MSEFMARTHGVSALDAFREKCWTLQRSAFALMDIDSDSEREMHATMLLTAHLVFLFAYLLLAFDKYFVDLLAMFVEVWPVKSNNVKNPLTAGGILGCVVTLICWTFWSWVGRFGLDKPYRRLAEAGYYTGTHISSFFTNIALLFIAAKLKMPEVSAVLAVLNFYSWSRWSVQRYELLVSGEQRQ